MHAGGFAKKSWNILKLSGCTEKSVQEPYDALWWFVIQFFFFFQRHKWTEPGILWDGATHSKMVQDSVCFFIPLHMQPTNIIYIMKTSSPI